MKSSGNICMKRIGLLFGPSLSGQNLVLIPKNAFSFCRDLLISSQVLTAQTIQHYETLPGDKNKMLPETHIGDHNFERPDKHRLETNTRSY